jgi:pseudouridine-5'-phosphate glycosidase
MIAAIHGLKLQSGMVLAVPIPKQYAAEGAVIQKAIEEALAEAEDQGVGGNQVTPFLLERIRSKTGGKSLEANIRLVKNNAAVGAQVAVALAALAARPKL